jgi:hypothetical protein
MPEEPVMHADHRDGEPEMPGAEGQPRGHWTNVYSTTRTGAVSWYQDRPALSLALIERACRPPARVLDVGAGLSFLVDHLLERGYQPGVLDIAEAPLARVRTRLGPAASNVEWFTVDVRQFAARRPWDVWHDRAVFHFLTEAQDRLAYRAAVTTSTRPGSGVIIAAFGPEGPQRCSGLPTMRYAPDQLATELGPAFELAETELELHHTPSGGTQQFVYCRFIRR